MQNHGGYSKEYEDLTNEIQFSDAGEDLRSVHQVQIEATEKYLTLIKKTDEAFENLIDYFQDEDEKTIILMFGDHQPAEYITNSVLRVLGCLVDLDTLRIGCKRKWYHSLIAKLFLHF